MIANNIQYITNNKGKRTAVLVPIEEWRQIQAKLDKFVQGQDFKNRLQAAFKEVDQIKSGKQKEITIEDFLNEC